LTPGDPVAIRAAVGLLDFIKPKSALQKAAESVREPYAQPDVRRDAMNKLFEIGTAEAHMAVLRRFTINAHGQIADESEKRELVDRLAQVGEAVLPSLKEFIRTEKKSISFPVRAVCKILDKPEAIAFLKETLQGYDPEDHRSVHAKNTLLITLGEMVSGDEAELFVPYLADHDDDVQMQAIAALERLAEERTREALVGVCLSDSHAPRVQRRAAQALLDLGWSVKDRYADFHHELKDEYLLGKKGQLVKKKSPEDE